MQTLNFIQQNNIFDKNFIQSLVLMRNEEYIKENKALAEAIYIDFEQIDIFNAQYLLSWANSIRILFELMKDHQELSYIIPSDLQNAWKIVLKKIIPHEKILQAIINGDEAQKEHELAKASLFIRRNQLLANQAL